MEPAQDHTANEWCVSISSTQGSVLRDIGEGAGPVSPNRSGVEQEPRSSFPSPQCEMWDGGYGGLGLSRGPSWTSAGTEVI